MDFSILTKAFTHWFTTSLPDLGQYQFGQRFTVVCFYIILSKAVDIVLSKVLLRIAIRTSFDVDEHFVRFIRRPAVLSVFLLGILHAALLEPPFPSPWDTALPNVIKTLVLAVWWIALIREITIMNEKNTGWAVRRLDKTRFYMLKNISRIILLFLGTPTVFLGFWFGGLMMAFFSRMFSKTVTTLDDIGTGKIDPIEEIRHSFDEVKDSVEESLHWGDENEEQQEGTADKPETGRVSSQEEQRAKEDQEALDALRQFQKGKK